MNKTLSQRKKKNLDWFKKIVSFSLYKIELN